MHLSPAARESAIKLLEALVGARIFGDTVERAPGEA
jgi:hypothetical protein